MYLFLIIKNTVFKSWIYKSWVYFLEDWKKRMQNQLMMQRNTHFLSFEFLEKMELDLGFDGYSPSLQCSKYIRDLLWTTEHHGSRDWYKWLAEMHSIHILTLLGQKPWKGSQNKHAVLHEYVIALRDVVRVLLISVYYTTTQ